MNDVNIHVDDIKQALDEQAEKIDEGMRLSVCSRCGHYPKLVFNEGHNCATGKCFREFVKEQIANAKSPSDNS